MTRPTLHGRIHGHPICHPFCHLNGHFQERGETLPSGTNNA